VSKQGRGSSSTTSATVGCDLAVLDSLCMPAFANHALVTGRTQGLEGTREFLRAAQHTIFTQVGWVKSFIVAEADGAQTNSGSLARAIWPSKTASAARRLRGLADRAGGSYGYLSGSRRNTFKSSLTNIEPCPRPIAKNER
jgi:hypothetical protein